MKNKAKKILEHKRLINNLSICISDALDVLALKMHPINIETMAQVIAEDMKGMGYDLTIKENPIPFQ